MQMKSGQLIPCLSKSHPARPECIAQLLTVHRQRKGGLETTDPVDTYHSAHLWYEPYTIVHMLTCSQWQYVCSHEFVILPGNAVNKFFFKKLKYCKKCFYVWLRWKKCKKESKTKQRLIRSDEETQIMMLIWKPDFNQVFHGVLVF